MQINKGLLRPTSAHNAVLLACYLIRTFTLPDGIRQTTWPRHFLNGSTRRQGKVQDFEGDRGLVLVFEREFANGLAKVAAE